MFLPFATDWKVVLSCCSVTKSCPILCNPWAAACQFPLFFTISWSLLKYISIESVMPFDHVILCCPFLLLPSVFPSPSNDYSGLISFRIDWFNLLEVKGLSRVFSSTTVQKHQYFSAQPSLWSSSHICTWLQEKP